MNPSIVGNGHLVRYLGQRHGRGVRDEQEDYPPHPRLWRDFQPNPLPPRERGLSPPLPVPTRVAVIQSDRQSRGIIFTNYLNNFTFGSYTNMK